MAGLPEVKITSVTDVAVTSAMIGGEIVSFGGAPVVASGLCWSTHENPTVADNKTSDGLDIKGFNYFLFGLTGNTFYYLRAYVTTSAGTGYSNTVSFKTGIDLASLTSEVKSVTDIDGNSYKTARLGNQTWMLENLKTTKYRNGDPITNITSDYTWTKLNTGAYCWYGVDDKVNGGVLYNWYAVSDPRGLAPAGWHVPSLTEINSLFDYARGFKNYLIDMGFVITLGGYRDDNSGAMSGLGIDGYLWLSDENTYSRYTDFWGPIHENNSRNTGQSVRCVKD